MRDAGTDTDHAGVLGTLAAMEPAALKAEAEAILPQLGPVQVMVNRTGLVMVPLRDTVQQTDFLLGDVLVAEAHLRLSDHHVEGYGMVIGRDLERAMAMALIDAALTAGIETGRLARFVADAAAARAVADTAVLRRIEATRVEMETF